VQKIAYIDTYDDFGAYLEFQQTRKKRIKK
jgi:hypothetical protein